jgi:hypothetical protein
MLAFLFVSKSRTNKSDICRHCSIFSIKYLFYKEQIIFILDLVNVMCVHSKYFGNLSWIFEISFIECQQKCNIPAAYFGDWYSQEGGADVRTNIDALLWSRVSTPQEKLECVDIYLHKQERSILSQLNSSMVNSTMLMIAVYVYLTID